MNSDLSLAAQRGWKIFPLVHSSRFAVSQALLHDATSNEAQIEHWENKYSECNWAVATGEESGVFAIKFSLDTGLATMREFGERDLGIWRTLQVRRPNELLAFLEWPAVGLPIRTCDMTAPGAHLLGEESYVPIPGPGMQIHLHCGYVDREAPALPASFNVDAHLGEDFVGELKEKWEAKNGDSVAVVAKLKRELHTAETASRDCS